MATQVTRRLSTATGKPASVTGTPGKPARAVKDALLREMEQDAKSTVVRPDLLAAITTKADELLRMQKNAARVAAQLELLKGSMREIEERTLPSLMDEAGIAHLGLVDDLELTREEEVYASISKANAPAATEWLIKNNFGALVKARIVVEVERGDVKILEAARKALTRARVAFEESGGVHAQTLKAFVREQLAKGRKLPKSITHHVQPRAVVKPVASKVLRPGKNGK